jgi:hypothetical protein
VDSAGAYVVFENVFLLFLWCSCQTLLSKTYNTTTRIKQVHHDGCWWSRLGSFLWHGGGGGGDSLNTCQVAHVRSVSHLLSMNLKRKVWECQSHHHHKKKKKSDIFSNNRTLEYFEHERLECRYMKTLGHPQLQYGGHTYETVWNSKTAGFTRHQFNEDASTLTTEFVSYEGNVIHSFTVKKRGHGPSPSPTPVPPSPAPSKSSCCHSSDKSCTKGQVCCKSSCNDPSTCSYTETGCSGHYGSIHNCAWQSGVCVVG